MKRKALGCSAAVFASVCAAPAWAQQSQEAQPPSDPADDSLPSDVVVIGQRGSAITDIAPLATLDADAVAAIGATTIPELLQAIRGTTQGADGAEPILLLNAQRISGYAEIGALPPEAIEKVEVLPEPAALKFGFPPTRRVVNFITKRNFRQMEVRASAGTTTRWGSTTEKANLGLTRLKGDGRLTLGLELRRTDALSQSDRNILPDPDVPFDAIGNITGVGGGEVDPALSAAAGQIVTIAPVPADPTLAGFAAGANRPRLFDLGPYRTLRPGNHAVKVEAVVADRIGETLSGSLSLSAEHSRDRSLGGPAGVRLLVPNISPYSPFSRPVVLNRYLTETAGLRQRETTTSLQAGASLRGAIAGWRWDLTAAFDKKQVDGVSNSGINPAAANAAIAAGADPFAPLDPALLAASRLTDRTRLRTRTAAAKTAATNTPLRLPAGPLTVTATLEAERRTAASSSRGANASQLALGRNRVEGGIAIDVPLASRRNDVLPFVGELSANASLNARQVGGFGALHDSTFGLAWSPVDGVQLLATIRHSATAPDMAQQLTPEARYENVSIFDYRTGRSELATLFLGGNPDLAAERRLARSLAINVRPFARHEIRVSATYEMTTIRDQTGTVMALTPQTEALLPDLVTRDAAGRLVSIAYRPVNFSLERQRALNFTLNASGRIGPAPAPGAKPPRPQPSYYGGVGPSIKFSDRLQLRPGTPELDLLAGDTVRGWNMPRVYGYAYGAINHLGHGVKFDGWYQMSSRIRNFDPSGDLRFSSLLKLNVGAYVALGSLLKEEKWAKGFRVSLDIANLLDARQRVTDVDGATPSRFQRDYLDPVGRTATLTLRKLF